MRLKFFEVVNIVGLKKFNLSWKLDFSNNSIRLLYLFLVTDIAFMFLHLIYSYSGLTANEAFSLQKDRGFSEIFQYIKEYWIAITLGALAVRTGLLLYGSWSLLFFYLLLDDAAEIHERLGYVITNQFGFTEMFNLRGQDFGEIAVTGMVAVFFLILMAVTYRFSDYTSRRVSLDLIIMMFALAFCGVFLDLIHVAFVIGVGNSALLDLFNPLFTLLEDGGELVIMSFIAGYAFSLFDVLQLKAKQLKSVAKIHRLEALGRK